ncbi:hypothetical protein DICPUDRAFT_98173 [Dictyostelium purpureum]|uniref:Uncharacterized protein n=1 Tax=Dictyostelium purpureum TaxID=5786 RepID=F0ZNA6_DICPU|nr:uncharacterized protein DICPUDRAFT_98173 [Dictyostelium purpureum]EGC34572.1 hypothetical protein DICPUDRAFT_98173 [Dictyostelium purpureum]|eukprot:XP_003288896.1 hypothetical protein DICPUDRAFT_98173 [Dictyostelium purpureum]
MTDILNNDFVDKDSKKKKQIFVAQEHQADSLEKSKNLLKKQQNKDEDSELLPLENEWSFWEDHYTNNNNSIASIDEYLNALKQLYSFSTIQEFWLSFNRIPNISKLPNNSCFHLFKKGTRPIWEENEEGGEFVLKVKKFQTDEIWNELVLSVVGEQFSSYLPDNDDICGISIRKKQGTDFNMIHIWNKNTNGREDIPRAIKHLFPLLLDECMQTFYREHGNKPQQALPSQQQIRMQQLKNMNKSASVLKPSSNAFVPRKTVRFSLPKSKSESVIASPTSTRNSSDNKQSKKLISTEEASPGNFDLKPILSNKTAKIPVSMGQIKDLKPKPINFDDFNQEDEGLRDDWVEEKNKEFEKEIEKEIKKEVEKEIQKRRPEGVEDSELEEEELGHEYSPIANDEIVPNLSYNNYKDEVVPETNQNDNEDLIHHGYSDETELPELKKQKINFDFDPAEILNDPVSNLEKLVQEEEEEEEEEELPKKKKRQQKKKQQKKQKPIEQEPVNESIDNENGALDDLLSEKEIKQLNEFLNQEKQQEQEQQLKETKDLLEKDLVQDEKDIDEKLEKEQLEKSIDKDIDDIVDELSESEIDEELNEEIDSWEQELGIEDPGHIFREGFKSEYKDELKKNLKEDIKEVVKEEINEIVENSKKQQRQQESKEKEKQKHGIKYDILSDQPTIEEEEW